MKARNSKYFIVLIYNNLYKINSVARPPIYCNYFVNVCVCTLKLQGNLTRQAKCKLRRKLAKVRRKHHDAETRDFELAGCLGKSVSDRKDFNSPSNTDRPRSPSETDPFHPSS